MEKTSICLGASIEHLLKNDQFNNMTKERWEGILQLRKDFFDGRITDLKSTPFLSPEIADSWMRCYKSGLNPYKKLGKQINTQVVAKSRSANLPLIQSVNSLFTNFHLTDKFPYFMSIDDNNGIPLHSQNDNYSLEERKLFGKMFDEKSTGTNGHNLCRLLKRPVQLQGPEHYLEFLKDFVVTTAPILDKSGEVIAILVLSQPLVNPPWDINYQAICSHTFALVAAMASAIENRINFEKSYTDLQKANNIINNTLAAIDEGIVTIDQTGKIMNINNEGLRILKLNPFEKESSDINELNFRDFLSKDSHLMQAVLSGKNGEIEEILCVGNNDQPYLIRCHPVLTEETRQVEGAVLRLNLLDKVNVRAAARIGTKAIFTFEDIIGDSTSLKRAITMGRSFSKFRENILLIGESGTGKELFAQAIHNNYHPNGPFIAVNCAAMPRQLIESELFGYEGGSFTGADRNGRPGKIELANGGTLFLDEIGDMPHELQAVLLRVLQDKQVMRIGGQSYKRVDFRVIAATNRNLLKMVENNLFREDLYYRLSVLSIQIPPLRERTGDIEILSKYFIMNYCQKMRVKTPKVYPEVQYIINNYNWPGNVRQLENTMTYTMIISGGGDLRPEHLPISLNFPSKERKNDANEGKEKSNKILSLRDSEKLAIENAISSANKNIPVAARLLGISKSTMYRKLREYNLEGY